MNLQTSPAGAGQPPPLAASGCLSFRLGAEEYGIDILKVQEIRGYAEPTRIAGAPPFIRGVINLRGVIVPIVDLRLKFGVGAAAFDDLTVVIVLSLADRVVGIVVDAVSDVVHLEPQQLRPAPEFNAAVDAGFITALGSIKTRDSERLLILTDIEALMRSPEMGLFQLDLCVH
jgi:purine-binding chemotaxis protein CheW